jgi:hypothetical protein
LLYYFKSKENIYNEIIKEAFNKLANELLGSIEIGGTASTQITRIVKRFLDNVENHPSIAKLMLRELIDESKTGAVFIIEQCLPVLELVENFFMEIGRLEPSQRPLLREFFYRS